MGRSRRAGAAMGKRLGLLVGLVALGAVGGALIAFAALAFGTFLGRDGSTGAETFGAWNPSSDWWLARHAGAAAGAILLPYGFFRWLRRAPSARGFFCAGSATLVGGLAGAVLAPGCAAMGAAAAFILTGVWRPRTRGRICGTASCWMKATAWVGRWSPRCTKSALSGRGCTRMRGC